MDKPSTEPSADMRNMASAWWQLYVALQREGFSDDQALRIVLTTVTSGWPLRAAAWVRWDGR